MRGVLTPAIKLWIFGSLEGLQVPTFGSVSFILTFSPKWGCDIGIVKYVSKPLISFTLEDGWMIKVATLDTHIVW